MFVTVILSNNSLRQRRRHHVIIISHTWFRIGTRVLDPDPELLELLSCSLLLLPVLLLLTACCLLLLLNHSLRLPSCTNFVRRTYVRVVQ